ncbi:MAG TPA: TRAP transporter large permease subunit [Limnochordales bacterium]
MVAGFLILLACLALGMPIYVALLWSSLYLLVVELRVEPAMIASGLFESINSFTLSAVPFFLLAGALADRTTMSERLVGSVRALVGHLRGGLALTGVVANEVFGAISGASAAAVGTIGRIMLPTVAAVHGEPFALGLLTSAGALAVVMPPSIPMILYAASANVSTGQLFVAGIIPALIIGLFLWACILWNSRGLPWRRTPLAWGQVRLQLRRAGLVLLMPVVVLGGIYGGFFTPTEAAAVAVAYTLALGAGVYRDLGWRGFWSAVMEAVRLTSQIFVVIAASVVFSQALALAQVPMRLAELTSGLPAPVFLLVVNLVLLLVGMFFDPTSAVLVLTPLLTPAAQRLGIHPLHLGVVMTVNLAIGMFTPPFGLNLFVSQSIFRKSMAEIVRGLTPFWVWYLAALAVITYLPGLYMWLPGWVR